MTGESAADGVRRQVPRWPGLVALTLVAVTGGLYVWLIRTRSTSQLVDPVPVVVLTLLAAVALGETVATVGSGDRLRVIAAVAVTGALVGLGVVAIFSVGLGLLLAVPFAGWHASLLVRAAGPVSASAAVGVGVGAAAVAAAAVLAAPLG